MPLCYCSCFCNGFLCEIHMWSFSKCPFDQEQKVNLTLSVLMNQGCADFIYRLSFQSGHCYVHVQHQTQRFVRAFADKAAHGLPGGLQAWSLEMGSGQSWQLPDGVGHTVQCLRSHFHLLRLLHQVVPSAEETRMMDNEGVRSSLFQHLWKVCVSWIP